MKILYVFVVLSILLGYSFNKLLNNITNKNLPLNVRFTLSLSGLLQNGLFEDEYKIEEDMITLRQRTSKVVSFTNMLAKPFLSSTIVSRKVLLDNNFEAKQLIYFPYQYDQQKDRRFPIIMYIHSGGFCIGTEYDGQIYLDKLSNTINAIIISIQYRLSPEVKYPIPLDDVYSHLKNIYETAEDFRGNRNQIVVAGESAGGNLAIALSMKLRNENSQIKIMGQYLNMPCIDPQTRSKGRASVKKYGSKDFFLNSDLMDAFWILYTPNEPNLDPNNYIDPINAKDLSGLPPMLLHIGGLDILHDEAIEFAEILQQHGNSVVMEEYPNIIHAGLISLGISFPQEMYHSLISFKNWFESLNFK